MSIGKWDTRMALLVARWGATERQTSSSQVCSKPLFACSPREHSPWDLGHCSCGLHTKLLGIRGYGRSPCWVVKTNDCGRCEKAILSLTRTVRISY